MKAEVRQRIAEYAQRVRILKGLTGARGTLEGLDKTFELALDESAEKAEERRQAEQADEELLKKARSGNQDAVDELCELRMEQVDLYVRAMSTFATTMFENITLKPNEQFVIEHSYRNPVKCRYIGQDGGTRTVKAVKARKQTYVDMRELTSDEVAYQMRDIQQGNDIAAAAQATVDVAWDLSNKVDVECFNLLQGGTINGVNYGTSVYGAFTTTGAPLNRTFVAHPRIQTSNLPTTNNLVLSSSAPAGLKALLQKLNGTSEGQSNLFRLDVIRAVEWYCTSFANVFGTQLRPTGAIHVPSADAAGLTAEIVPTGTFFNKIAEGILENYTQFDWFRRWTIIPDVTLPAGACYIVLNRPVGKMLTKPSLDQEFVESNPRKNIESRVATKVIALATFEPDRVNALKVQYSDAYSALSTNE